MTSRRRKQEGEDYEAFLDAAEKLLYENAWEFRQWLVGHYRGAGNPAECLAALVAALYGRLARQGIDCDFEPEELAKLFDETIAAVDAAGARHKLIHVTEAGGLSGLDEYELDGASDGTGSLMWCEYVAASAADDARDAVTEKHHCAREEIGA